MEWLFGLLALVLILSSWTSSNKLGRLLNLSLPVNPFMTYSAIVQLQCFVNISKYSLLEQTNRRALATNEWLRVRECEGVYAIGDCATVSQRKIMVCVEPLIPIYR